MKILKYITIPLLLVALLFSCSKRYEDDPITMKFVALKKRIEGEWHIEKILIDEQDYTYIIDVDSLKIYSIYDFDKPAPYTGGITIYNKDKTLKYGWFQYSIFYKENENLIFKGTPQTYLDSTGTVPSYGAINNIGSGVDLPWEIKKLTKKEFHLVTNYQSKQYELFFTKD
jgi:hypothetical protein